MRARSLVKKWSVASGLALAAASGLPGSLGCESAARTTPEYRPGDTRPPPPPMPRAMESSIGIHVLSSELSEDYLRRLQQESADAEAADSQGGGSDTKPDDDGGGAAPAP